MSILILCVPPVGATEHGDWINSAFHGPVPATAGARKPKVPSQTSALDPSSRQQSRRRLSARPVAERDEDDAGDARERKAQAKGGDRESSSTLPARPQLTRGSGAWSWPVRHAAWTSAHEAEYEAFIRSIGESDCRTVDECLTSPVANPAFAATNPLGAKFYSDCADLPFSLRAYFAWRKGLPFSFSTRLAGHVPTGKSPPGQVGYQVAERHDVVGPGPDFRQLMKAVSNYVTSNHFRVPAHYRGAVLPDHYPVRLDRESIRAGAVIYDPDGHVAVVYKVSDDGRIHYVDAHPDNSLTRGVYGRDFVRTVPDIGAGFKRWRPQRLVGATTAADGTLVGGRIELAADSALADWSDEQFIASAARPSASRVARAESTVRPRAGSKDKRRSPGRDRPEAQYAVDGRAVDYYDFLRLRLAPKGFRYDPLTETRSMIRHLCDGLRDRVHAVERAVEAGLSQRPQPPRLPPNIYATNGDWELYSTPSRDARLKVSFEELRDEVERFLELAAVASPVVVYQGTDLARDLSQIYAEEAARCPITYRRSDGSPQQLAFDEVRQRLFLMSFDPHHCPERRWGASESAELATCREDATKRAWYFAQGRLRNQLVRTYGEPMGWTLGELGDRKRDIGHDEPSDIDVTAVLKSAIGVTTASAP